MTLSRREFLRVSAMGACTLVVSTGLSGCGSDESGVSVFFNHGVASGDPLKDKVIVWTRTTPSFSVDSLDVNYEVSTTSNFSNIVRNGVAKTSPEQDFTVKVDVQGLEAGTKYYYRFSSNGATSVVGEMKTLPTGSVDKIKMAVFTCANYPNGYFNAYDMASKIEDLDVTVHVGDYIYEYGMYENDDFEAKVPAYATKNAVKIGRALPTNNDKECIALEDYRRRYALYHTDEGLQAIHKACPMIAVWDDHEIANDTYKGGAQNHDDTEGSFEERTAAALQAYFEWMPIRPIANKEKIFRNFEFGDLISLNMLETRIFGRDKQLEYADYYTATGFDGAKFFTDISSPTRTMMGAEQTDWLQSQIASSSATWLVLGQQVLMGRMSLPAELLAPTSTPALTAELTLLKIKKLKGGVLTLEEETRLATAIPYNLDAWDGYPYEREVILGTAKAYNKNLVVLAGDTHNSWSSDLKDKDGNHVGVEFASPSVTSPGLEEYLGLTTPEAVAQTEGAFTVLIDDLKYANLSDRGFMEVVFTKNEVTSNWHHLSNYDSKSYTENVARAKSLKCLPGVANRKIVAV